MENRWIQLLMWWHSQAELWDFGVTAQLGFVWPWEAEHHQFMALFWELLLLRGAVRNLCSSSMCPSSWACQHCGQQDGRAQSPGDEGAVTARTATGTGLLLTLQIPNH